MYKQIKLAITLLALLLTFYSCEKENSTTTTSNTKKQSALNDLFKNLTPPMQNFTINAGQNQVVTGEKGTQITFYANSFKRKDGTIPTSGQVKIVLQEMLTGPEMILAAKTTTSNGKLLQSGGQIYIKAYQNGEELLVNKSAKPQINIPMEGSNPMNIFYGKTTERDSIKGDTTINWEEDKTDTVTIKRDSSSQYSWYNFQLDSFTYINCDYFMNSSNLTDFKVNVPSGFVDTNTAIFIYFPTANAVTRMYSFDKTTNSFNLGDYYRLPTGFQVKLFVVVKKSNKFYYEILNATISNGLVLNSNPNEATEAQIKLAIKSL